MPTISLIIPVYNGADYLDKCLQSIKCQTFDNYEVILVDDGSTDDSFKIMASFSDRDKRFKAFKKCNGGVSSARNYGLSKAAGEWIAFVDADDWISPLFCQKMYQAVSENNLEVVLCRRIDEKEDGSYKQEITQKEYLRVLKFEDFIPTEEDFYGTCWGFLFSRSMIGNTLFDETISFTEDALFSLEVMSKASRIGILNEYLYYYNLRRHKSLSQGSFDSRKYTIFESRKRQIRLFNNKKARDKMTERLEDAYFYFFFINRNDSKFMIRYYPEIKREFRKYFKYWSVWNRSSFLRKYLLLSYYIDLDFGYHVHACLKKIFKIGKNQK